MFLLVTKIELFVADDLIEVKPDGTVYVLPLAASVADAIIKLLLTVVVIDGATGSVTAELTVLVTPNDAFLKQSITKVLAIDELAVYVYELLTPSQILDEINLPEVSSCSVQPVSADQVPVALP